MNQNKVLTGLLFLSAVMLSSVAAYYSIAGLAAIFAAAVIPIVMMGSVLEVSKLVVASWLYRNWQDTPKMLRTYFVSAIVVLMLLTSMGIFGFLSKAHLDQNLVSGDVTSKLALIDEKIHIEKENIDANRKIITQLDSQVNETIARSTDESGATRSAALRRSQAKERSQAQAQILSAQEKVNRLNEERAPIAAEVRSVEAEVGPVKYIAQLIYGQEAGSDTLEKAVRLVILMIVFVFDPLAVLMFIAVNSDMKKQSVSHNIQTEPNVNNEKHFDHLDPELFDEWIGQDVDTETVVEVIEPIETIDFSSIPEVSGDFFPDVIVEHPARKMHVQVNDAVTIETLGAIKHDRGMHGIFTTNF